MRFVPSDGTAELLRQGPLLRLGSIIGGQYTRPDAHSAYVPSSTFDFFFSRADLCGIKKTISERLAAGAVTMSRHKGLEVAVNGLDVAVAGSGGFSTEVSAQIEECFHPAANRKAEFLSKLSAEIFEWVQGEPEIADDYGLYHKDGTVYLRRKVQESYFI